MSITSTMKCGEAIDRLEEKYTDHTPTYLWYILFLLFVVSTFNYVDRIILSVVLQPIKEDLGLSDTQLGLLTGFAFALFYAGFGIPIARWADRGNRRNIIALALTIWSLMTALTGLAQNFIHMFLARIGVGVGEAGCNPPAYSLISDYFPMERRSTAMAVYQAGSMVGLAVGLVLGGSICARYGWRMAFFTMGLPGLLLALFVRFTLKEPLRGLSDGITTESKLIPLRKTFRILWETRSYVHLLMALAFSTFGVTGLELWLPSYYIRQYGLSTAEAGQYLGLTIGVGAFIGILAGGNLADRLIRRDVRWALWMMSVAFVVSAPCYAAALLSGNLICSLPFVFLANLLLASVLGPILATLVGVLHPNIRALGSAGAMFVAGLAGQGLGPFAIGFLSDLMAPVFGNHSLKYALLVGTTFLLFALPHIVIAAKHVRRDMASLKNIEP